MSFPCLSCNLDVRARQQAVECDWCQRWQHRKCGTGISQAACREAVKMGGVTYVCGPCREAEVDHRPAEDEPPTLERSDNFVPMLEGQVPDEPPTLEPNIIVSVCDDEIADEMPTLEPSVPYVDAYEQATLVDDTLFGDSTDIYMPTPRDEVQSNFINGDEFLVADISEDGQRHFIFGTDFQLDLLQEARRWYMDGTFKVVGDPFKRQGQLMSIHAFINKNGQTKQVPLVYCLMSRRTKADYVMVMRALAERLGRTAVEGFVLDYEQAAWLAIREVFPAIEVKGCAFHWSQAAWRHVQDCGLAETYRRRVGVYSFIRMLLALQFLPSAHIRRAFQSLVERATSTPTITLVDYMRRQWMEHSIFSIDDWSVYRQDIRTNNDVEGWHHRLNSKAGGPGLGFYRLVPLLRRNW